MSTQLYTGLPQRIIDDTTLFPRSELEGNGLIPRDYDMHPVGYFCPPMEAMEGMVLYPEDEWVDRINEKWANESWPLHHIKRGKFGKPCPNYYQNGWGYCTPPGTLIRMGDGSQKPIESVRLLDEVLTAEGNVRRVCQLHVRDHDGEMVTVKMWGHGHLRLTPNHSVLTKRGYVPAGDLTSDDYVAIPRFAPESATVVQTANHVNSLRRVLVGGGTVNPSVYNDVPDFLRLTPGLGRILGLWLAEGFTDKNSVFWAFNVTETDTLAAELVSLLKSELDIDAKTYPGPGPNVTIVEIHGKLWAGLFKSLCGHLAGGKRLHSDITNGPRDFLEAMFWGWMAGDGCVRNTNAAKGYDTWYNTGATISRYLAIGMFDIANLLGLQPSICKEKPQENRHAKTRQPCWKVNVNTTPSDYRRNFRLEMESSRMWRKVRRIDREPYVGKVHNIGVEGDNSYVAESVGVHNCWYYSTAHAMTAIRAMMGLPYVALSPFAAAYLLRGGKNQGGWGGESAEDCMNNGIPEDEVAPNLKTPVRNTPELQASRARHKLQESYMDLQAAKYDRKMSHKQYVSAMLQDCIGINDYPFWSHSVCATALKADSAGNIESVIWNSHDPNGNDTGDGVLLKGSKAWPEGGCIAVRAATMAA